MYEQETEGDHCCRICLTDVKFGGGIDIFSEQGRKEMLPYKIRRYLYITVSKTGFKSSPSMKPFSAGECR